MNLRTTVEVIPWVGMLLLLCLDASRPAGLVAGAQAEQRGTREPLRPPPDPTIEERARKAGVPFIRGPLRTKHHTAAERLARQHRLEEVQRQAQALLELAGSLRSDLAQTSDAVLPFGIAQRAAQIEKLAREIKRWGKGQK